MARRNDAWPDVTMRATPAGRARRHSAVSRKRITAHALRNLSRTSRCAARGVFPLEVAPSRRGRQRQGRIEGELRALLRVRLRGARLRLQAQDQVQLILAIIAPSSSA